MMTKKLPAITMPIACTKTAMKLKGVGRKVSIFVRLFFFFHEFCNSCKLMYFLLI